ncbi:xanthine dehydrogenase family protein molybdopterin-binding subunit [Falsiroseomonas oryzae]|uniref:xanthine dehydrogenase family protein molybdopterin-binding subunit n=1 Tax=Falsiroseomonas oryzae TaxID=2766473 RepID=UPI0022EB6391|nr:molybdopterin cofactor-binding domain-containing protein [Roseomonas sp. MO-31]
MGVDTLSRRGLLAGLAAGAAGLAIGFRLDGADAQPAGPAAPAMLRANPQLDSWVRITPDGRIVVLTGRVELGQGILTAMRQIAAEELDVAPERLALISGDTAETANEGVTAGSQSVRFGGEALAVACADARATLVGVAAQAWGVDRAAISVRDGVIQGAGGRSMTYAEAASRVSLVRPVDTSARRKPPAAATLVGTSYPRTDIPAKVFGQQVFIHDLRPEGMLFGAVARPPGYAARLVSLDMVWAKSLPGVIEVVRDGSFLGVIARREEQANEAARMIAASAEWREGAPLFGGKSVFEYLRTAPSETRTIHSTEGGGPGARRHTAEYRRGFQAHASIGASCALARWEDGRLTVWSHSQGPFPLRGDLARGLRMQQAAIRVIHVQGSGCYGHNGADDVALDAALLARAVPGRTVRVHWTHEEEMTWAPWGSAMVVRLEAGMAGDGALTSWAHDVWSFPHSTRPASTDGCNLRAAWYLENPVPMGRITDGALPNGAAARNAVPIYAVPGQKVTTHFHTDMPVRTSALRTLGGYFNAVAAEMFMDECAAIAGVDPVAYRLRHLRDPRLVAVLRRAVEVSGWQPRPVTPGRGRAQGTELIGTGVGLSKYKNSDAHVAVVARVAVDVGTGAVRVQRLWAATEAGRAINPDGIANQIEGGMVQATSWTLMEEGRWDHRRITSEDYHAYPIIDFGHVPPIESVLIDRPDLPSIGVGEGSQAPTGAAIANAILDATGRHVPEIPFTPERVLAALRG